MSESRREARLTRRRGRRWAEMLMENSSLRADLDDEEAKQLLDWGLAQIKATVLATIDLSSEEVEKPLEKDGTAVKLIMKGVNDLIGAIGQPLTFDVIDDTMTRLLKNYRWLTNEPLTPAQLENVQLYNQAREAEDREAAFQYLMALIQMPGITTHD